MNNLIAENEKKLLASIRYKQDEEAVLLFRQIFTTLTELHGDYIGVIKGRILELLIWLSRSVFDLENKGEDYHLYNAMLYENLYTLTSLTEIQNWSIKALKHFAKQVQESSLNNTTQIVHAISRYIQKHYREKITIEDIAASVHLNGSYISHLFSKTFGYTITDYITYVRLENAKILLANPTSNISSAAIASGFSDVSYFSKVFKKIEGVTPREYKNQNLK